jgi:hypothetical protein
MNYEIIEGSRAGSKNYVHQRQVYRQNYTRGSVLYLKCVECNKGCKGSARLEAEIVTAVAPHSGHAEQDSLIAERKAKEAMRRSVSASAKVISTYVTQGN